MKISIKNNSKLRVFAFTLAEVLITLGVIGFTAVLTLPILMRSLPSSNKIMFKKSYYILNEAINGIINSDVAYPAEQTLIFTDGEHQRGLNFTTATVNGTTNKFCFYLTNSYKKIKDSTCPTVTDAPGTGNFTTTDGIYFGLYIPISDSTNNTSITGMSTVANTTAYQFPINADMYTTKILIDVNGVGNPPDCTLDTKGDTYTFNYDVKCKDPDRFIVGVRYDGNLQIGCSTVDATTGACTTTTDANAISILSDSKSFVKN